MALKIHKITEAFSMQPEAFWVGMPMSSFNAGVPPTFVDVIVPTTIDIDGEKREIYAGYDAKRNLLFYFLKATVNVIYDNEH